MSVAHSTQDRAAHLNAAMDQKILLIDDSAILRRIATNVLGARAGCGELVTATRASEGFARACAPGIGLILMDYQLSGPPNADLCRRLQDEPRTSRVPVVLLLSKGMTPPVSGTLPGNVVDVLVSRLRPSSSSVPWMRCSNRRGSSCRFVVSGNPLTRRSRRGLRHLPTTAR